MHVPMDPQAIEDWAAYLFISNDEPSFAQLNHLAERYRELVEDIEELGEDHPGRHNLATIQAMGRGWKRAMTKMDRLNMHSLISLAVGGELQARFDMVTYGPQGYRPTMFVPAIVGYLFDDYIKSGWKE